VPIESHPGANGHESTEIGTVAPLSANADIAALSAYGDILPVSALSAHPLPVSGLSAHPFPIVDSGRNGKSAYP
jgi:hypothetical protein